jgi:hypothetical protein
MDSQHGGAMVAKAAIKSVVTRKERRGVHADGVAVGMRAFFAIAEK